MKSKLSLWIMILPTALLFAVFCYLPMCGLILAFRNYDIIGGLLGYSWAGFKFFEQFFRDPYFPRIVRNTLLTNLYMILVAFPAPIILVLWLNEIRQRKIKKLVQSVSYLPHFLSAVVVVGIMIEILSSRGIVNQILAGVGIPKQLFFNDKNWFRFLYVSSSTWESMGWNSIIYFAALAGINPELYESADIEGAGRFAKIRFITVPCLLPTIVIMFILTIGSIMTVGFEKVFLMYNPGTYATADVISTYVYRRGVLGTDYSYATAVGMFNSVVNFALLIGANYAVKKAGMGLW